MALVPNALDYDAMAALIPAGEGVAGKARAAQVLAVKTNLVAFFDARQGGGANITAAEFQQAYVNIIINIAHQGTSPYAVYDAAIPVVVAGNPAMQVPLQDIVKNIRVTTSTRLWHRAEADLCYRIGKAQTLTFNWGRENCVPEGFGYLGFDTADYITIKLSHEERKAINSSFHYAARFASTSVVTDAASRWSAGTIHIPDTK